MYPICRFYGIGVDTICNKNHILPIGIIQMGQIFGYGFSVMLPSKNYIFVDLSNYETVEKIIVSERIIDFVNRLSIEGGFFKFLHVVLALKIH